MSTLAIVSIICFITVMLLAGFMDYAQLAAEAVKKKEAIKKKKGKVDVDMTGYIPYARGHSNMPYNPNWNGGNHPIPKNYNVR